MQPTMTQALPQSTSRKNSRVVRVEPDVKSIKTRKLFNAGVIASAQIGKSAYPTCYNAVTVKERTGLFENVERAMSETMEVLRDGRVVIGATDLIHSPDDNGYYFHQADFSKSKCRTSVKIYPTEAAAKKEWGAGTIKWEPWY